MPLARRLAVLILTLAAVLCPQIASARAVANPETRVWGFELVAATFVGADALRSPEDHLGKPFAYGGTASGYRLAAGGGAAAVEGAAARFIAGPGGSMIETGLSPGQLLMPGGARIGQAGASAGIRVIQGGATEAGMMFEQLAAGGTAHAGSYAGTAVSLPGGGFVGMRMFATGTGARALPAATIDVRILGIPIRELKFVP